MPIVIKFNNRTFQGRKKRFYFWVLDVNDFLLQPFDIQLGENNTFANWSMSEEEIKSYRPDSSKRRFCEWFVEQIKHQDALQKVL